MNEIPPDTRWVAGLDGFRSGWFAVFFRPSDGQVQRRRVDSVEDVLDAPEAPVFIGVDMVIGLPDRAARGGRSCDREARSILGYPRSSSVFSPPAYAALSADSFDEARRLHTATADDAPGITIQAFHLLPKMRELSRIVTPGRQDRVREVHPELSFYEMNGRTSVNESKHDDSGQNIRRRLLAENGFPDIDDALAQYATGEVGADDVLDAHAVCWSAARMANETASRIPEAPATNERGLRMEIWW
ncbi:hypothetical protein CRI94_14810 [Longibacter salinarum]|uniref:DUF429 domain-containing protein n=1 Tax=Longibacter salinarum TaxID=1850348 RepID=A0A2A8CUS4_9BACT|nr:DUF429 domain-containing protein [Longibacter salinarum]PEN12299.1 hypothetical protein CRI94_14810 [Longibacter salinarum]